MRKIIVAGLVMLVPVMGMCADGAGRLGERPFVLMLDPQLSKEAGAVSLISLYALVSAYSEQGYLQLRRDVPESVYGPAPVTSWGNRFLRAGKAIVVDSFVSRYIMVFHHEFFGHASWDREYNNVYDGVAKVDTRLCLDAGWAFPFFTASSIGGSYRPVRGYYRHTIDEWMALETTGVESTQIMSDVLAEQMIVNGQVDYYSARLRLDARTNMFWYIVTMPDTYDASNDMQNYLDDINAKYWSWPRQGFLTKQQFQKNAWLIVLEPMNIICFYETYRYIMSGDHIAMPMIRAGNTAFLPYWSVMLSPYGVERTFGARGIYKNDSYFNVYYRIGDDVFVHNYDDWGLGCEVKTLHVARFMQGVRLDLWNQPGHYDDFWNSPKDQTPHVLDGFNLSVEFLPTLSSNLTLRLGYKTRGYLPGQPLHEGGYGSVALTF